MPEPVDKTKQAIDAAADGGAAVTNAVLSFLEDDGEEPQKPVKPVEEPAKPVEEPAKPLEAADPQPATDDNDSLVPADVISAADPEPSIDELEREEEALEAPENIAKDPKANKAWQKGKEVRKQLRDRVKALEAEVERAQSQPLPEVQEVQTLQQKIADYEKKLGQYNLAETEEFRQKFDEPLQRSLQKGVSLLVRAGRTPEEARVFLNKVMKDGTSMDKLQDALVDEPVAVQGAIINLAEDMAEISSQREAALASWQETNAALKVQSSRDREIQLAQDIEKDTSAAVQQAVKEGNWMFASSPSNQDWNKLVQERVKAVKGIVKTAKPAELFKWVVEGVTAKTLREMYMAEADKSKKMKAELARLVQASPKMGDRSGGAPTPKPADGKPRDPMTLINEVF